MKLLERVPARYLDDAHHWLILHGRYVCLARMPQCGRCAVAATCDFYAKLPPAARPKPGQAAPDARALRDAGIAP
jgi:endonuclease III